MLYVHCTHMINKSKMLVAGQKRKHVHETLRDKAQALNLIENAPLCIPLGGNVPLCGNPVYILIISSKRLGIF